MSSPVFAYAHQITPAGLNLLRDMVGVIEDAHPERERIDFATLRVGLTDLPFDIESRVYTFHTDPDDMEQFCRWLRWTSKQTGKRDFAEFAAGMERGAKMADREMVQNSQMN